MPKEVLIITKNDEGESLDSGSANTRLRLASGGLAKITKADTFSLIAGDPDRDITPDNYDATFDNVEDNKEIPALTEWQEQAVHKYMPFVDFFARKVAERYGIQPDSEDFNDLVGDGYIGLVKAVRKYDPDKLDARATTGSSYIGAMINGYILHGLRDKLGRAYEKKDADGNIIQKGGIARLKPSVISGASPSLDRPVSSEGEDSVGENYVRHDQLGEISPEEISLKVELQRILQRYSPEDQEIFIRRFYGDQTQEEIANVMDRNQMYISRKLRKMFADIGAEMDLDLSAQAA
jgi:RNA polymerase sigma factor (sigma-70 family)